MGGAARGMRFAWHEVNGLPTDGVKQHSRALFSVMNEAPAGGGGVMGGVYGNVIWLVRLRSVLN